MISIEEAVQRGSDLLDTLAPDGWREKINLDTLDTCSLDYCVLGQIYGWWDTGMNDLFGIDRTWDIAIEYGFDAPISPSGKDRMYRELNAEWRRVLS